MIATTVAQLREATGARTCGVVPDDLTVTGVSTDSRDVAPGDLFVAVRGERHDGHDHAAEAISRGATVVMSERAVPGVPSLVVPHSIDALGDLAAQVRRRLGATVRLDVIGITGSVGKTSTKDMLAQVLSTLGRTVAPRGSYNNELGLPTTVLRCDESTRYLVLELGARGIGHVRRLTDIARPRIGIVLNVGSAHLGEFGSLEATALAKGELVEALPPAAAGGVAVLFAEDPRVRAMSSRTTAEVRMFGAGSQVHATDVRLDGAARPSFDLHVAGRSTSVALGLHGVQCVTHALAVATVADVLGMDVAQIGAALEGVRERSPGRMHVAGAPGGITVVDDSYNASPESVAAALAALTAMVPGTERPGRRTWAVLGQMRELGASSVTEHLSVGRLVAGLGVSRLVVVGEAAAPVRLGALEAGMREEAVVSVPDVEGALAVLRQRLRCGDVVLVKASRAEGLDRVATALLTTPEQP